MADAHLAVQVFVLIIPDWDPIQQDLPRLGLVETLQQCHTGGFAAAVQTHQRRDLPRNEVEGDVLEGRWANGANVTAALSLGKVGKCPLGNRQF